MEEGALRTRIRKGDLVRVISGKERGKEGKVLSVIPKKGMFIVERLNMIKRATKPSQSQPKGGIIEREGRIHFSNVMMVCANCNKAVRIATKPLPDGKKLRVCRKCGEPLDKEA